ncbi:hypothetical protein CYY_007843 [Polysphondylium violaceum]|uniref:non-specific serine/threonine protein kinase n=1 Tax=Polysphondylium violaceum TaxID=133409 RepID=A0A8J4PP28_9MYCE|nr:hypothetical protein CYY_007843 [Polysphondylium violaceum]
MEIVDSQPSHYSASGGESSNGSNLFIHLRENEQDGISYRKRTAPPKLVKHYILGEVLGEGAYGKVKDGMDSFTQKRVAVKILKRARLKKIPGGEASVLKEINITKKLHNKHIIKLIDHFVIEEKGKLYIVYEYVGGGTLQNLLENSPTGKLPAHQSQFIFKQLIAAIEYIHSEKILHRDIKPDNILFTHSNVLKLSDFGVSEDSSLLEDFECLSRSYGSPAFQPPELTQFQTTFSPFKIDIWAMGVTLYLMTIGKFPFSGSNMFVLFENISKCNIEFPNNIDRDLVSLIKGILQVDHNQRYSLGQIKNHPWCTKEIDEDEPFVELLPETKFAPLAMAYGQDDDDDYDDDELIFGYENDANSIQVHNGDHHQFNNHNNNNNNGSNHSHHIINNHHVHHFEDYGFQPTQLPPTVHIKQPQHNHHQHHHQFQGEDINDHNMVNSHHHNNDNTIPTITTMVSSDSQPDLYIPDHIPTSTNDPNRASPQPPLRNSSARRPKITFESPQTKSKCTIN